MPANDLATYQALKQEKTAFHFIRLFLIFRSGSEFPGVFSL
jgi:hypothetical protein